MQMRLHRFAAARHELRCPSASSRKDSGAVGSCDPNKLCADTCDPPLRAAAVVNNQIVSLPDLQALMLGSDTQGE